VLSKNAFLVCFSAFLVLGLFATVSATIIQFPESSDWVITEPTIVSNQEIVLNGNLIVRSSLTFDNVTLRINSSYSGEYGIYVTEKASMTITGGSVLTSLTEDAMHRFVFAVYGSDFTMQKSQLSECSLFLVRTDNSVITDNQIAHSDYGIYVYGASSVTIIGNTITAGADYSLHSSLLTIQPAAYQGIALIDAGSATVSENKVSGYQIGLFMLNSKGASISDNELNANSYGAFLQDSPNNVLTGNTINDNLVDGIVVAGTSTGNMIESNAISKSPVVGIMIYTANNVVTGNSILDCGEGIYVMASSGNAVTKNEVSGCKGASIAIVGGSTNNLVSDNTLTAGGKGLLVESSTSNTFASNNIRDNGYGMWVYGTTGDVYQNNYVSGSQYYGIALVSVQEATIDNNTVVGSLQINLFMQKSSGNTIINSVIDSGDYGIYLTAATKNTLNGIVVSNNKVSGIVVADGSNDNIFIASKITANGGIGIYFKDSSGNSVSSSTFEFNNYAIYAYASPGTMISGNTITKNGDIGIALSKWSDRSTVTHNTISGHLFGIYLYRSEDLTVAGNSFSNNQYYTFTPYSMIDNPTFESAAGWQSYSTILARAMVQDSSQHRAGSFSGMTDTSGLQVTVPSSEKTQNIYATVSAHMAVSVGSILPTKSDSLELWLYLVNVSPNGAKYFELRVVSTNKTSLSTELTATELTATELTATELTATEVIDGVDDDYTATPSPVPSAYTLHYRWRLDGSALPADTATDKYIDMGTSMPVGQWMNVQRDLYRDWTNAGLPTNGAHLFFVFYNEGTFTRSGNNRTFQGQQVNFDSTYIDYAP